MTAIETRALDLRRSAALELLRNGDLSGAEALVYTVCPPEKVRAASLEAARLGIRRYSNSGSTRMPLAR